MRPKRIEPKAGQESVWDYPRPPRLEQFHGHVRVELDGKIIADSNQSYRVLETSHPPVYYIPMGDIVKDGFIKTPPSSFCEWKGSAHYFDIETPSGILKHVAWGYDQPNIRFELIRSHVAFYAHKVGACYVNDEKVQAQEGDFYGGWITSNIVGPFKGIQGSFGW